MARGGETDAGVDPAVVVIAGNLGLRKTTARGDLAPVTAENEEGDTEAVYSGFRG